MDELTSTFVNESRDQLMAMEDGLLKLEQNPDDTDNLGAILRTAHTIKGGSGVVACPFIEAFTHKVGEVALILDVPALVELVGNREERHLAPPRRDTAVTP